MGKKSAIIRWFVQSCNFILYKGVKKHISHTNTTHIAMMFSKYLKSNSHKHWKHTSYLSFLLHRQDFRKPNFTPKKWLKAPKTLKMSLKKSNICIFFTQSGKIYTWQKIFTQTCLWCLWQIWGMLSPNIYIFYSDPHVSLRGWQL